MAAFAPLWRDTAQALAVVDQSTYQLLQGQGLPMVIRASSPRTRREGSIYIVSRR